MTYCLGIQTHQGLVMASDSRTNAGMDLVNVCRKMHLFVHDGERVFIILASGGLSITQSVITLLRRDFDQGRGPGDGGDVLRRRPRRRRADPPRRRHGPRGAASATRSRSTSTSCSAGRSPARPPHLYLIYPQGNPIQATEDSPYLQIGESKYGRPILDRAVRFRLTTLDEAVKFSLISIDSTMRSNVTVGPPIDLVVYQNNDLRIRRYRRFTAKDPDLQRIQFQWEHSLRKAALDLPDVTFEEGTEQVM